MLKKWEAMAFQIYFTREITQRFLQIMRMTYVRLATDFWDKNRQDARVGGVKL